MSTIVQLEDLLVTQLLRQPSSNEVKVLKMAKKLLRYK